MLAQTAFTSTAALIAVTRTSKRLQARLDDLMAERDDALCALAEAHAEQELGLPCFARGALEARLAACQAAITALHAELDRLARFQGTLDS